MLSFLSTLNSARTVSKRRSHFQDRIPWNALANSLQTLSMSGSLRSVTIPLPSFRNSIIQTYFSFSGCSVDRLHRHGSSKLFPAQFRRGSMLCTMFEVCAVYANFLAHQSYPADSTGEFDLTTKVTKSTKFRSQIYFDLRVLRTTIVQNLRRLDKLSKPPGFRCADPGYKRRAQRTYGRIPCAPTIL